MTCGVWFHFDTIGTGVYYNVGRSLRTHNRVTALHDLGLSYEQIAALIHDMRMPMAGGATQGPTLGSSRGGLAGVTAQVRELCENELSNTNLCANGPLLDLSKPGAADELVGMLANVV